MTISSILAKIPPLICLALLCTAVLLIWFRSRKLGIGETVKVFKKAKYVTAGILAGVLLMTSVSAVLFHLNGKNYASAIVALNYSKASQAQNSNGTRYNMAEITCDEVISRAIEMGAMEDVSVKDLKACLSVYPYVEGGVRFEDEYHISTEFVLEYYANRETAHLDSSTVVQLVTMAYKDYYVEKYVDYYELDREHRPDFDELEYMDAVDYFQKEATGILNYLYGLQKSDPSFLTEDKTSFGSLASKVHQFKEVQIDENLRSLILQNGVAKDRVGLIDRLHYQNNNTDFTRRKDTISFDLCNQAVKLYAEEMTRIVLVPTWDEIGKYYMGRTKVGIDELSMMATAFSDAVAESEKSMMDNRLVADKMQAAVGGADQKEAVDRLILTIDQELDQYAEAAISAGRQYSARKLNRCIGVSVYGVPLSKEVKDVCIWLLLFYAAFALLSVSFEFPRRKR